MTHITLLGAPIEEGAGRRGCLMGPAAYRTAGLPEDLMRLGHEVADLGDATPDDTGPLVTEFAHLKQLGRVAGWTRSLHRHAFALAQQDTFPIYMGGDHALALGTLSGHVAAAAQLGRPQFALWLDAHADFNTFASSPSGNLHGTPLAFACGLPGFDVLMDGPLPATLPPENACIMGLRSVDDTERTLLDEHGVTVHDMRAIDEDGFAAPLRAFLQRVKDQNGLLHVSLDVDFLDPEIAPAVGTTVPGGATFREAHFVMELLHESGLATSLDLVELNPFLDVRGRTAQLMSDLTASLFGRRVFDRKTRAF